MQIIVNIIESPSDDDILKQRFEGHALRKALALHGIPVTVHTAVSQMSLAGAFKDVAAWYGAEAGRLPADAVPWLHLSAHGNQHGIAVTGGEPIPWSSLEKALKWMADTTNLSFGLSMSSCKGFEAWQAIQNDVGVAVVVGPTGTPTWSETLVGFSVLYYQLSRGVTLPPALEAMKAASLHDSFQAQDHGSAKVRAIIREMAKKDALARLRRALTTTGASR